MQFTYKVKNKEGQTLKGKTEAVDLNSATLALKQQNFYVIEIKPIDQKINFDKFFRKKVNIKEKIVFTKQLGVMTRSGLSIIEALEALQDESQNKYFAEQIKQIISSIKGGKPLSRALEDHPDTFPEIYISMIESGEKSGKVESVLDRLAIQLEKDYDLSRKIKSALAYPIFILVALVGVAILVLTFVIPQLTLIFEDAGVELPLITRIIISLSNNLQKLGIYYLIGVIALVMATIRYKKTDAGTRLFDKLIVKLPAFGALLKKTYMARFARNFSALSSAGLPLLDVFKVTGKTIGNIHYQEAIEVIAGKIKSGKTISDSIKSCPLFPKMVGQLASVGEKTGNIDQVFDVLADFFDKDIDNITSNLSTMLEPLIMIVLGAGVGVLIVAVIQPMYGLVNAI